MRKFRMHVGVSLDGYAEAPDHGFDWIVYNPEIEARAHALTRTADTVVFGRNTYKGMQSYWPTVPANPESSDAERGHAAWLERSLKLVVSKNMPDAEADWPTTRLLSGDIAAQISAYRETTGGDMVSFGSPTLVRSMVRLGLFDELHININPVVLGGGRLLFEPQERQPLTLLRAQQLPGGVVALVYAP